jgi:WhiB family transcriptional regulator, redox-sensing transcriptional regulator
VPAVAVPRPVSTAPRMRQTWDLEVAWQSEAGCRGSDANLFFSPTHLESKEERQVREIAAKAICAECVVRRPCLDFALLTREPHGIWGGMNELERRHAVRAEVS